MEFKARNTNDLAKQVYPEFTRHGVVGESRNGPALRLRGVTTITLTCPWQRVNFSEARDANPFFHLVESIAMLVGWNSVNLMTFFAKNMKNFTDDGVTYNAFYGTRARMTFGDQLSEVVKNLRKNPSSRQELVQLWDPADLTKETKDKACNLCMLFEIDQNTQALNMTTFNRSNDAIWGGVTGANIVHLSFFQEFVALSLNVSIGEWHHSSANLHIYLSNPKWEACLNEAVSGSIAPYPPGYCQLFESGGSASIFEAKCKELLADLEQLCSAKKVRPSLRKGTGFIDTVVQPMALAYILHKSGFKEDAEEMVNRVAANDWRIAGTKWLRRHSA